MQVKMLVGMAGTNFSLSPGDVTERFSADECQRLIAKGVCEPVGLSDLAISRASPTIKKTVKRGGKKHETASAVNGETRA